MIARQRHAIEHKVSQLTTNAKVWPGLLWEDGQSAYALDAIPGIKEAGWSCEACGSVAFMKADVSVTLAAADHPARIPHARRSGKRGGRHAGQAAGGAVEHQEGACAVARQQQACVA